MTSKKERRNDVTIEIIKTIETLNHQLLLASQLGLDVVLKASAINTATTEKSVSRDDKGHKVDYILHSSTDRYLQIEGQRIYCTEEYPTKVSD